MGCPHNVKINVLDCNMIVGEFNFKLCYYIHFWTWGRCKLLYPISSNGLSNTTTTVLQ